MRIWKLTPIDPSLPVWDGHDIKPMFVRAESCKEAQDLAQLATVQYRDTPSLDQKLEGNWRTYRTRCEGVTDTCKFTVDGPPQVLRNSSCRSI